MLGAILSAIYRVDYGGVVYPKQRDYCTLVQDYKMPSLQDTNYVIIIVYLAKDAKLKNGLPTTNNLTHYIILDSAC